MKRTAPRPDAFERKLRRHLKGASCVAVLGVGDEAHPRDRLGIAAARRVKALRLKGVHVFLTGIAPESFTGPVRRLKPDVVLILDAADWGARPGSLAVLEPSRLAARLLSTHSLPLAVLVKYLRNSVRVEAVVVGIQPSLRSRERGPTRAEASACARLARTVQRALAPR